MEEKEKKQFQIDIRPDIAMGTYSNMAMIASTSCEFILDFVEKMPGMPKGVVASRVIMAPEHAKLLLLALQDSVMKYERQFGQINLPRAASVEKGNTIAPFQIKKGDA